MITYRINENMWDEYLDPQYVYGFTTNGTVKNNGQLVMGRGTAKQVADMHPGIPAILGDMVSAYGNMPFLLPHNLVSIPTKHDWKDEQADTELITESLNILFEGICDYQLSNWRTNPMIKMPLPGAGVGKLDIATCIELVKEALFHSGMRMYIDLEVYYYEWIWQVPTLKTQNNQQQAEHK